MVEIIKTNAFKQVPMTARYKIGDTIVTVTSIGFLTLAETIYALECAKYQVITDAKS